MNRNIGDYIGQGLMGFAQNLTQGQQAAQQAAMQEARLEEMQYQRQRQDKQDYMQSYDRGMDELTNDALMKMATGQSIDGIDPSILRRVDPTKLFALKQMADDQAWKASMGMGGQSPGLMSPQGQQAPQQAPMTAPMTPGGGGMPPQGQGAQQGQAPIWQRQNNPGNLRVPGQKEFQSFPDLQTGLDAYYKQIDRYGQRGLNTIRKIVSTYAPPNENNTEAYIAMVSKSAGLGPDDPIDFSNPQQKVAIGKGMTAVEGSGKALTDDMHMRSVGMGPQMAQAGPQTMTDASGRPPVQGQQVPQYGGQGGGAVGALQQKMKLPPEEFAAFVMSAPKQYQPGLIDLYKQSNPKDQWEIKEGADGFARVNKGTGEVSPITGLQPKPTGGKEKSLEEQTRHMRDKFTTESKPFLDAKSAYNRIAVASKDDSPAGDMAMVFAFMKMLDPGSTVREGEFALAENTRGVPDTIRSQYNKILEGQRLTPQQRSQFVNQAGEVFKKDRAGHDQRVKEYGRFAGMFGYDPAAIIQDYTSDLDNVAVNPGMTPAHGGGQVLQFDAQGNMVR